MFTYIDNNPYCNSFFKYVMLDFKKCQLMHNNYILIKFITWMIQKILLSKTLIWIRFLKHITLQDEITDISIIGWGNALLQRNRKLEDFMEKLNTWNFGDEGGSFHFLSVVLDDDIVDTRGHWEEGNVAFVSMVFPCDVGLSWAIYLHVQFTCESQVKIKRFLLSISF